MNAKNLMAGLCLGAFWFPGLAMAQSPGEAQVEARSKQLFGQYLTDAKGRTVYMFVKDKPGESNCYDACAEVWPPFITSEKPRKGEAVNKAMVDTIIRKDGRLQVTYNSMPLYYYVKDQSADSTAGQDLTDRFGYLVAPSGKKIEKKSKS